MSLVGGVHIALSLVDPELETRGSWHSLTKPGPFCASCCRGGESESDSYIWSGCCAFVYLVSHESLCKGPQ